MSADIWGFYSHVGSQFSAIYTNRFILYDHDSIERWLRKYWRQYTQQPIDQIDPIKVLVKHGTNRDSGIDSLVRAFIESSENEAILEEYAHHQDFFGTRCHIAIDLSLWVRRLHYVLIRSSVDNGRHSLLIAILKFHMLASKLNFASFPIIEGTNHGLRRGLRQPRINPDHKTFDSPSFADAYGRKADHVMQWTSNRVGAMKTSDSRIADVSIRGQIRGAVRYALNTPFDKLLSMPGEALFEEMGARFKRALAGTAECSSEASVSLPGTMTYFFSQWAGKWISPRAYLRLFMKSVPLGRLFWRYALVSRSFSRDVAHLPGIRIYDCEGGQYSFDPFAQLAGETVPVSRPLESVLNAQFWTVSYPYVVVVAFLLRIIFSHRRALDENRLLEITKGFPRLAFDCMPSTQRAWDEISQVFDMALTTARRVESLVPKSFESSIFPTTDASRLAEFIDKDALRILAYVDALDTERKRQTMIWIDLYYIHGA